MQTEKEEFKREFIKRLIKLSIRTIDFSETIKGKNHFEFYITFCLPRKFIIRGLLMFDI